jgi:hypothetical protein
MYRIIVVILLSFILVPTVYGQSFEVMAVSENLQEAVLKNTETGEEWVVSRGEVMDGWRVMEIAETHVTLGGWVEGIGLIAAQIPVMVRLVPSTQRP